VIVECCQVEIPVSSRSLVQRSPTEGGMSECDREASNVKAVTRKLAKAPKEGKEERKSFNMFHLSCNKQIHNT
jgi:hypothetical protein